jgi:predicted alpha/beta superfamily hydrolase
MFGRTEPPRTVQIPDYPFDHEVRVLLPPSYDETDEAYPTLWVTDNTLELAAAALMGSAVGYAPELIVVSIGGRGDLSYLEFQRRRTYDFTPGHGEVTSFYQQVFADPTAIGGAARFRDFLIDELRPQLAGEYRMDTTDHCLAGHSGGGSFALYSLFTRADGFAKYLIGSPGGNIVDWQRMDAEYAAANDDLAARVYLGVGAAELTDGAYMWGGMIVGFTDLVAVTGALVSRGYASLELTASVIPNQDHFSVWPVIYTEGVRALWPERCSRITRADTAAILAAQNLAPAPGT